MDVGRERVKGMLVAGRGQRGVRAREKEMGGVADRGVNDYGSCR